MQITINKTELAGALNALGKLVTRTSVRTSHLVFRHSISAAAPARDDNSRGEVQVPSWELIERNPPHKRPPYPTFFNEKAGCNLEKKS